MVNNNNSNNYSCRFCGDRLAHTLIDLGMSPVANSYLEEKELLRMEPFYPLKAFVCTGCFLVQVPVFEAPERIFGEYAYFSSCSTSWLEHARVYCEQVTERFGLNPKSRVIEIASNDGYLLRSFKEKGIPVLGIEPARNVARAAVEAGIPTINEFFGDAKARELARENIFADLLIGNNVLAHVPDINGFVSGMKTVLGKKGVITMEFPHLMQLILQNQFDTIYHEHFSYLSLITTERIFAAHGLVIFDVEELPTHGGSLRIYARHEEDGSKPVTERVHALKRQETDSGFTDIEFYAFFEGRVRRAKRDILDFMLKAKLEGKTIAGYGAPAKGNTLLNYCGIRTDFLDYTVDISPHKQGRYLPGTHIPIHEPARIGQSKPDYLLILPWNLREEIMKQMSHIRSWGGKFVVLIPEVRIYP